MQTISFLLFRLQESGLGSQDILSEKLWKLKKKYGEGMNERHALFLMNKCSLISVPVPCCKGYRTLFTNGIKYQKFLYIYHTKKWPWLLPTRMLQQDRDMMIPSGHAVVNFIRHLSYTLTPGAEVPDVSSSDSLNMLKSQDPPWTRKMPVMSGLDPPRWRRF